MKPRLPGLHKTDVAGRADDVRSWRAKRTSRLRASESENDPGADIYLSGQIGLLIADLPAVSNVL
jgi:hypothetical protein